MKKFLTNLLLVLIPFLVISGILEYKTRTLDSYYKDKKSGFESQLDNIEVLVLGNSHSADGIDPNQFSFETYNMAFRAQTLFFDKRITLSYLSRLPKLKYVFINVSYSTLYFTHKPERDVFYHYFYDIDYMDKSFIKEDISYFYFGYTPNTAVQNIFDFKERVPLSKGWISYDTTNIGMMNLKEAKKRVGYFNEIIAESHSLKDSVVKDLNDFIIKLKSKNITPIIITPPLHEYALSFLDPVIVKQNNIDIQTLCMERNIEYWDYLKESFQDSEFYNPDHLNEKGAARFSRLLNERLLDMMTGGEEILLSKSNGLNH